MRFDFGSLAQYTRWFVGILRDVPDGYLPEGSNQDELLSIRLNLLADYQCVGQVGGRRIVYGCLAGWEQHFQHYYQDIIAQAGGEKMDIHLYYPNRVGAVHEVRQEALTEGWNWLKEHYSRLVSKLEAEARVKDPNVGLLAELESERQALYEIAEELSPVMSESCFAEKKVWPVDGVKGMLENVEELKRLLESFANGANKLAEKQGTPAGRVGLKTLQTRLQQLKQEWIKVEKRELKFLRIDLNLLTNTVFWLRILERDTAQVKSKLPEDAYNTEPLSLAGLEETEKSLKRLLVLLESTAMKQGLLLCEFADNLAK